MISSVEDDALRSHGGLDGGEAGAEDARVAVDVRLVHVDQRDVRVDGRDEADGLAGVRIFDELGAGVAEHVGAADVAQRQERHAERAGEVAVGERAVRPLVHLQSAGVHRLGDDAADFHPADVDLADAAAGGEQRRIVGAELRGEPEVALALANHLAHQRTGAAAPDVGVVADVEAVFDEAGNGVLLGHTLVDEAAVLVVADEAAHAVGVGRPVFADALVEDGNALGALRLHRLIPARRYRRRAGCPGPGRRGCDLRGQALS